MQKMKGADKKKFEHYNNNAPLNSVDVKNTNITDIWVLIFCNGFINVETFDQIINSSVLNFGPKKCAPDLYFL